MTRDHGEAHGRRFRQGIHETVEAIRAFDPTLVVIFGSDHRRAFVDSVPASAVCLSARGMGDHGTSTDAYQVPSLLAADLVRGLRARGLDVAEVHDIELDHGFGHAAQLLLGGISRYPTIPVFINCATAPMAPISRAAALGAAVGDFLADAGDRVLFIGSGGLSHDPPTLAKVANGLSEADRKALSHAHREAAKERIRPDWDQALLYRLTNPDTSWVSGLRQGDIDPAGIGANEVRTWLAAYLAAGLPLRTVVYERVDEWLTGMGIAMSEPQPRPKTVEPFWE